MIAILICRANEFCLPQPLTGSFAGLFAGASTPPQAARAQPGGGAGWVLQPQKPVAVWHMPAGAGWGRGRAVSGRWGGQPLIWPETSSRVMTPQAGWRPATTGKGHVWHAPGGSMWGVCNGHGVLQIWVDRSTHVHPRGHAVPLPNVKRGWTRRAIFLQVFFGRFALFWRVKCAIKNIVFRVCGALRGVARLGCGTGQTGGAGPNRAELILVRRF